jgi:hypothetical protein
MKTYGGEEACSTFLDRGTRCRWAVSNTSLPLYPWGKRPWYPLYRGLGSVVGWDTMLQTGRSRGWLSMRSLDFSIDLILPTLGLIQLLKQKWIPGMFLGAKWGRCVRLTLHRHLWVDCLQMWEPRRVTTLWASTACYRVSFTFYLYSILMNHTKFQR